MLEKLQNMRKSFIQRQVEIDNYELDAEYDLSAMTIIAKSQYRLRPIIFKMNGV
jgi:hypothetical protein